MSSLITTGIVLLLAVQAQAQLTQKDNTAIKSFAKEQLQKGLGFKEAHADLARVVQASQVLEILGETPKAETVCPSVDRNKAPLTESLTVSHLYNLVETHRLFRCESLSSVPGYIEKFFENDVNKISKPANLHYSYLMSKRAKDYGIGSKTEVLLSQRVNDSLIDAFNQTDFSVKGGSRSQGLSGDSLKALEIFSSLTRDTDVGPLAKSVIASYAKKIALQGVINGDRFSYFSQYLDESDLGSATLNYLTLQVLKNAQNLESVSKSELVGFRNFFVQKAALSTSLTDLLAALRGLQLIGSEIPAVRFADGSKKTLTIGDSSKTTKLEIVNSFGQAFQTKDTPKVALVDFSDNKGTQKNITSEVKLAGSIATWTPDNIAIGRYRLQFTLNGYSVSSPTVVVSDQLAFVKAEFSVVGKESRFPSKFEGSIEYPKQVAQFKQASDDHFIHVAVQAGFVRSTAERPAQIFLSLRKKDDPKALSINSYAKLNRDSGLYEITLDVNKDVSVHLNGEYLVTLTAADYRAEAPVQWNLGTIKLWYKEGHDEGSNNGVRAEYQPLPVIVFNIQPDQPQISLVFPLVGVAVIVLAFLRYFQALIANRANLSRLNFAGVLFLGNLLLILFIFTSFFIEVKLIPTLWLLLFLSPITFFLAQRALQSADCSISPPESPAVRDKKKNE